MTPTQFPKTVVAKDGKRYRIILKLAGQVVWLELCRGSQTIGYARCILEGPSLLLGDLIIEEPNSGGLIGLIRQVLQAAPKTYRGKGLGTALLQQVIATSKDLSIQQIHGSVTQADLDTTPHLLDWFKRHGFQVEPPTEQDAKNAIARIYLNLKNIS